MTHFSDSFELNILIMYSLDHEFTILLKILKNWFWEEWAIYGQKSQILAICSFYKISDFTYI